MLDGAALAGFVPVRDLEAAEKFYSGTLGLRVIENNGFALVLASGGATLRCALTPDFAPQPFTIAGWNVPDLASVVAALSRAGVRPNLYPHVKQDEAGIWTAPGGDKIFWFSDPDGNGLSLAEHAESRRA